MYKSEITSVKRVSFQLNMVITIKLVIITEPCTKVSIKEPDKTPRICVIA